MNSKRVKPEGRWTLIIGAVILVFLICAPYIYFAAEDLSSRDKIMESGDIQFSLDDQTADIYIVRRVHKLINSFYLIAPGSDGDDNSADGGISIGDADISDGSETEEPLTSDVEKTDFVSWVLGSFDNATDAGKKLDKKSDEKGRMLKVFIGDNGNLSMKYDSESGKVYEASGFWSGSVSEAQKETLLRRVLNYEELLVVGDWYYSNGKMISRKAGLALVCHISAGQWKLYFDAI